MMTKVRFLLCALVLFLSFSPGVAGEGGERLTAGQWRADLHYLYEQMAMKHKDLYHATTKAKFDEAVEALDKAIPNLATEQIEVEIAKLVALAGDGHTAFELVVPFGMHGVEGRPFFPVDLYLFKDGLFVRSADPRYAGIVGGKVVKIGASSADEALSMAMPLVSRDNPMDAMERVPRVFSVPELMKGLGLCPTLREARLTVEKGGRTSEVVVEAAPYRGRKGWVDAGPVDKKPLWQKHPDDFYWFEYLPSSRTLYVQVNAVANKRDEPIAAFVDRLFGVADRSVVDRFVLDIRNNGGGNNALNRPILLGIIRHTGVDRKGTFFTIIGRRTFSAAMNLANALERYTNVTFVGEPTGGRPNSYGDNTPIEMPNSRLKVFVSTLWWQDQDPRDRRDWIAPEIAADMSSDDYRRGTDAAMDAILRYVPTESIADRLRKAIVQRDGTKAGEELRAFLADPRNRYVNVEAAVNGLGYSFMGEGNLEGAIRTFQLNVETYPKSANVYDSLAEAYLRHGDTALALENYRRSLELNPSNSNAREAIRSLQQPPP